MHDESSVAMSIFKDSFSIGLAAAVLWPFKAKSTDLMLECDRSWKTLVRSNGGYFPIRGLFRKGVPPQHVNVFVQMFGNAALHLTAEQWISHPLLIPIPAALGAFPGTVMMTFRAAGIKQSLSTILRTCVKTPRARALMCGGFGMEAIREWLYNVFCINGHAILTKMGFAGVALIAASGSLAMLAGVASGGPNGLASLFYSAAYDPNFSIRPKWYWLRRAMFMRGLGIGGVFTIRETVRLCGLLDSPKASAEENEWSPRECDV